MALEDSDSLRSSSPASSILITRIEPGQDKRDVPSPSVDSLPTDHAKAELDDGDAVSDPKTTPGNGTRSWNPLDNIAAFELTLDGDQSPAPYAILPAPPASYPCEDTKTETASSEPKKSFHGWMRTLHKRALQRETTPGTHDAFTVHHRSLSNDIAALARPGLHRNPSSQSSFRFVTSIKSASVSLASASVFGRSRRNTLLSSRGAHSRTDRSSRASVSGVRLSEESSYLERSVPVDPAAMQRCLQRRRILEELINTEEGYIGDVKFLMNVYITILASLPTLPAGLRSSINRNLTDIVELHEDLLSELHRAVPHSEYTQIELQSKPSNPSAGGHGHHRWRSLDAVPEDKDGMSWLYHVPGMTAEPQVAAEVAKVFAKKMNRFFIYEEYGAKYEMMIKDVASAHRTMPQWDTYQRGLETLASSLGPAYSHGGGDQSKKALTIGDLLVKPIQRVCKYPLLFAELLKYTPVCDCPYSHMEIENALIRLREATAEINRATDDARIKTTLEKTWLLQDRLVFPNQRLDAVSKNRIRSFGHIQLCGALHVCWQTKDGVSGQYMISLLYRDWLCLATASRVDQIYTIQACIGLVNIRVEEVDNGRGLQCHTAPFSWKIVFECDHQLYEVIMTACTPKEQHVWRTRLCKVQGTKEKDLLVPAIFSSLSLNVKSLGTVFGKPGTIARRLSIHRATTVGPKSPLCQVILKNTSVIKDLTSSASTASINRSQSLLTTNSRIPVLAPSRGERARLEALLSDVWSRDALPFPGMTARSRSEHLVRTSASSMIRKLSVASIASSFTKRSASLASMNKLSGDGDGDGDGPDTSRAACLNRDGASAGTGREPSCRSPVEGDASRSRLAAIPDEGENAASPLAAGLAATAESEWAADVFRTIRRLDALRLREAEQQKRKGDSQSGSPATTAVLCTSSPNSARLSRKDSQLSKASSTRKPDKDKENMCRPGGLSSAESFSTTSQKSSASKWSRVGGGLHRGAMVQGLRNLFR